MFLDETKNSYGSVKIYFLDLLESEIFWVAVFATQNTSDVTMSTNKVI